MEHQLGETSLLSGCFSDFHLYTILYIYNYHLGSQFESEVMKDGILSAFFEPFIFGFSFLLVLLEAISQS